MELLKGGGILYGCLLTTSLTALLLDVYLMLIVDFLLFVLYFIVPHIIIKINIKIKCNTTAVPAYVDVSFGAAVDVDIGIAIAAFEQTEQTVIRISNK